MSRTIKKTDKNFMRKNTEAVKKKYTQNIDPEDPDWITDRYASLPVEW